MTAAILISLLSLAVSALALWFNVFKDYIDRPRIAISFDPNKDLRPQWKTKFPFEHDGESQWLRLRVTNIGKWKAVKNCRVYLVGLDELLTTGGRKDWFATDCRQLRWMHDHDATPQGKDLLPRVPNWFDVISTYDGGLLVSKAPVHCFPEFSLPHAGTYRLKLQVSSDNASNSVIVFIDVVWQGGFSSLNGKLISTDDVK